MTSPDPRRAIVERREAVAAEPRPTPLAYTDLPAHVAAARAQAELHRVYRSEWVTVNTAQDAQPVEALTAGLRRYFAEHYQGRVHPQDVRLMVEAGPVENIARLQLLLPTLKAEFKTADLARRYADEQGYDDAVIVARKSEADHKLRNYGVTKLPGAPSGALPEAPA